MFKGNVCSLLLMISVVLIVSGSAYAQDQSPMVPPAAQQAGEQANQIDQYIQKLQDNLSRLQQASGDQAQPAPRPETATPEQDGLAGGAQTQPQTLPQANQLTPAPPNVWTTPPAKTNQGQKTPGQPPIQNHAREVPGGIQYQSTNPKQFLRPNPWGGTPSPWAPKALPEQPEGEPSGAAQGAVSQQGQQPPPIPNIFGPGPQQQAPAVNIFQ